MNKNARLQLIKDLYNAMLDRKFGRDLDEDDFEMLEDIDYQEEKHNDRNHEEGEEG